MQSNAAAYPVLLPFSRHRAGSLQPQFLRISSLLSSRAKNACARDSFAPVQLRLEFRKACLGAHASAAILCLTRSVAPRDELHPLNPVD
jgi:hypothetical protein